MTQQAGTEEPHRFTFDEYHHAVGVGSPLTLDPSEPEPDLPPLPIAELLRAAGA